MKTKFILLLFFGIISGYLSAQTATIKGKVFDYAVSIDSVENFTNIDFYPSATNYEEKIFESSFDLKYWK